MSGKPSKRSKRVQRRAGDTRGSSNRYAALWQSRGFVVGLVVIAALLSVSVGKEGVRRVETRYDIERLEEDVARLESRNTELQDVIALLNTSSVQDKQARVKLNVQAPGEQVVVFPHRQGEKEIVLPDSDRIEYIPVRDFESNPEKWFHYFWDRLSNTT